jgi:hypothetical protein
LAFWPKECLSAQGTSGVSVGRSPDWPRPIPIALQVRIRKILPAPWAEPGTDPFTERRVFGEGRLTLGIGERLHSWVEELFDDDEVPWSDLSCGS